MQMNGKLDKYIMDVDKRAEKMYENIVNNLLNRRRNGITQSNRYARLSTGYEQYLKQSKRDCYRMGYVLIE